VVDVLKITSPISIKSKVQNIPSKLPTDASFDITNPGQVIKEQPKVKNQEEDSGSKQSLSKNLNKEIFEPLLHSTRTQADGVRKLVLMARLFENSAGNLSEAFLDRVFVRPQEMLAELLTREKGATIFAGEFFDSLRILAKLEGQPRIRDAIVAILKHFDGYVNQENSLKAVVLQGQDLLKKLSKTEMQAILEKFEALETMVGLSNLRKSSALSTIKTPQNNPLFNMDPQARLDELLLELEGNQSSQRAGGKSGKGNFDLNSLISLDQESQTEIKTYLKNEIIPELGKIVKRHQGSGRIHSQVMAIVHSIVRYDKADPSLLEDAIFQLGDELKPLTKLSDEDIIEMRRLVFEHAVKELQQVDKRESEFSVNRLGMEKEDSDMASLLSKALDPTGPAKVSNIAQNLLFNMLQNESPMMALIHFTIPFRYQDENTYGEFFVDKECKDRRGDSKDAKNIFFTIQSDKYGNFEVDLLVKDKKIDLDIRCPDDLLNTIRETKSRWRDIIEDQGYRLSSYQVGAYQESQPILLRFPKLAGRKVGLDVKV
jgi:hypothetical protein